MALGIGVPGAGLAAGIAALALWVSPASMRSLDALVAALFVAGLASAIIGYARGADERTRRFGIIALGWNAVGLALLIALYALG